MRGDARSVWQHQRGHCIASCAEISSCLHVRPAVYTRGAPLYADKPTVSDLGTRHQHLCMDKNRSRPCTVARILAEGHVVPRQQSVHRVWTSRAIDAGGLQGPRQLLWAHGVRWHWDLWHLPASSIHLQRLWPRPRSDAAQGPHSGWSHHRHRRPATHCRQFRRARSAMAHHPSSAFVCAHASSRVLACLGFWEARAAFPRHLCGPDSLSAVYLYRSPCNCTAAPAPYSRSIAVHCRFVRTASPQGSRYACPASDAQHPDCYHDLRIGFPLQRRFVANQGAQSYDQRKEDDAKTKDARDEQPSAATGTKEAARITASRKALFTTAHACFCQLYLLSAPAAAAAACQFVPLLAEIRHQSPPAAKAAIITQHTHECRLIIQQLLPSIILLPS